LRCALPPAGLPRLDASLLFVRLFILFYRLLFPEKYKKWTGVLQLEMFVCQKKKNLEKHADLANQQRWTAGQGSITVSKRVYLPTNATCSPISSLVFFPLASNGGGGELLPFLLASRVYLGCIWFEG
jgi:hypothetical protein